MDFIELAKDRFSVREFSPRPVEDEKITKILQAAKVAPTAVNYQPQKLYVIKSTAAIEKLAGFRNIFGAPLAIIVCYDENISWKNGKDNGHPVAILPLGYPSEGCLPSNRHAAYRADEEMIRYR